jgi:aspartate/methionine/tyrosine aminotransferase
MFAERTNWDLTPNALSEALRARRAAGKRILDLTASNPTECGFIYDGDAILAALGNAKSLAYQPEPRGLLSAREAVCAYYAERGDAVSPENVLLTTSTSEAYSFVFRLLCNPGDEVLVPQPSYPLFDFLADLQDVRLARYPLLYDHGWQIDFHSLEQVISERTRAIIVVHPNNPTGNFCRPQEIAQLHVLCAARGLTIIADEVFLDYALEGPAPQSFVTNPGAIQHGGSNLGTTDSGATKANANNSGVNNLGVNSTGASFGSGTPGGENSGALTFTLSGISKICGLPQMKAAWLAVSGPEPARTEALNRLEVIADTYLSMNAPIQHALPALLALRAPLQSQLQRRVRANLAALDRLLQLQQEAPGATKSSARGKLEQGVEQGPERGSVSRLRCAGGWYAVLTLPPQHSSETLALQLLTNDGVYVHPGHFYDFPAARHAVVSLITPAADFSAGVQALIAAASAHPDWQSQP